MYRFGLIGYPLDHSYSGLLHQAAMQDLGLEGEYVLYPMEPLPAGKDLLFELFSRMKDGSLHGLNITIPHKQALFPYIDELTIEAQAIGAINTIIPRDGKLIGANTDAPGFTQDLIRYAHTAARKSRNNMWQNSR